MEVFNKPSKSVDSEEINIAVRFSVPPRIIIQALTDQNMIQVCISKRSASLSHSSILELQPLSKTRSMAFTEFSMEPFLANSKRSYVQSGSSRPSMLFTRMRPKLTWSGENAIGQMESILTSLFSSRRSNTVWRRSTSPKRMSPSTISLEMRMLWTIPPLVGWSRSSSRSPWCLVITLF